MSFGTDSPLRQIFTGNMMLVVCCAFYLLWWILAFRPEGAIKGFRSGWLLLPAFAFGVAAVVMIVRGNGMVSADVSLFSSKTVIIAGIAVYIALLIVTGLAFHRQVTTELFLIVGWTVLVFLETDAVYGAGAVSHGTALWLLAAAVIAAAVSMVCYLLYYGLSGTAGYIDGMIPLVLTAVFMAALSVMIARAGGTGPAG